MASEAGEPAAKKMKEGSIQEGILFAMGNPLLDISAECDEEFLKKYGLEANNAILAEDKHKTMYDDMCEKYTVEYVPGGATQNAVRVAQWSLGVPNATSFVGCIGKDKYGEILEKKATEAGVKVAYQYHEKEPTGTCAVLVTDNGKNRSLCAYLAAANCFTPDHISKPEVRALMEKAKYFYISAFPLTVSPEAMLEIAQFSAKSDGCFCMNLSAPFLCQFFKEPMMKVMPYVDILFGNESEAAVFAKEHEFGTTDVKEIAQKIAALPKERESVPRMVVITQGAEQTIVIKDGKVQEFPIIPIEAKDIIDTNGAGDAFVGGFLAELIQGHSLEEQIAGGNKAANIIIQRSGCSLPEKK